MDRESAILAVLASAGENATFTPVQVQKLFFLVDREAARFVGGPHFAFVPYDYGPFDRSVYDELDRLSQHNLAIVQRGGTYRVYTLSREGYRRGTALLTELPSAARDYIASVANWVRTLSFQQLVASIYNRYPEMKANSVFRG
jgi:hypothetical protein